MKGRRPKTTVLPQYAEAPQNSDHLYLSAAKPPTELRGTTARKAWKSLLQSLADENRKLPVSQKMIVLGYCSASQLLADSEDSIIKDGILLAGGAKDKSAILPYRRRFRRLD